MEKSSSQLRKTFILRNSRDSYGGVVCPLCGSVPPRCFHPSCIPQSGSQWVLQLWNGTKTHRFPNGLQPCAAVLPASRHVAALRTVTGLRAARSASGEPNGITSSVIIPICLKATVFPWWVRRLHSAHYTPFLTLHTLQTIYNRF